MATIERRLSQDGEETFRVKVRLKGTRSLSASFGRKTDARKWAQMMESKIREGRHFGLMESKRRTINELLERYEAETLVTKAVGTRYTQKAQLGWWKKQIGHHPLCDVTPSLLSECKSRLLCGEKGERSHASDAFNVAVCEWQWLQESPMGKVKRLHEPMGRTRYLKSEELPRLLQAARQSENRLLFPLIMLALATGSRKQELVTLRRKSVDLNSRTISIERTKNGRSKVCDIPEGIPRRILEDLCEGKNPDDFLFPNVAGSAPMYFRTAWENARNRAGIPDFRFHDLKHSCGSFLQMTGAGSRATGDILGHSSLTMPLRYSHVSDLYRREAVQRMSDKYLRDVS